MKKLIFIISLMLSQGIHADQLKYLRVIDGDTVKFEAPWVPKPLKQEINIRIMGIDTPEKRPLAKCPYENMKAIEATKFVKQLLNKSNTIDVELIGWDKYGGRMIGKIIADGADVGTKLIENKLARPYSGGKKSNWCIKGEPNGI